MDDVRRVGLVRVRGNPCLSWAELEITVAPAVYDDVAVAAALACAAVDEARSEGVRHLMVVGDDGQLAHAVLAATGLDWDVQDANDRTVAQLVLA